MKNIKKRLATTVLLATMCVGILAGCSGKGTSASGSGQVDSGNLYRVGFVNLADTDENCYTCETVFKQVVESDEFKEKIGVDTNVEVLVADSDSDIEKQTTNVETMLAQGIDALFMIGVDTDGNSTAVEACNAEGVPVFMIATEASSGDYKFIGFDEVQVGEEEANWVVENLPAGSNICYLTGTPGREATVMREEGFMNGIKDSDLTVIGSQSADFDTSDAMQVTEDFIQAYGDKINCIVSQDGLMAGGAIEALKAANMLDNVTVCGLVTQEWMADLVKEGSLKCGIYIGFDTLGQLGAELLADLYSGKDIPDVNNIDLVHLTEDNITEYFPD